MPNLVATGGLTVYNITQLGADATTGASSTFLITPNEGYFIAATQFGLAEGFTLDDYPEISSINFNDTTSAFTVGNEVLVSVNWNGVTDLSSDYNINIDIFFNNADNVYDVNSTSVNLNIVYEPGDANWINNTEITVLPQQSLGINQVVAFEHAFLGYHAFSFDVVTSGQTAVCDIQFKAGTGEGNRFFNQDIDSLLSLVGVAGDSLQGTLELVPLETLTDLFGNNYMYTYRLFYTRVENSDEDTGTHQLYSFNPPGYVVSNVGGNLLIASGFGHGDVIEGAGTTAGEISKTFKIFNIPLENIEFSFSDTWAQLGDSDYTTLGGNSFQYYFDVDNITSGITDRSITVSLKDNVYNIVRKTFTITQYEVPQIQLKVLINTVDAVEIYIENSLDTGDGVDDFEEVFADAGKIISTPNSIGNYYLQIASDGGPQNTDTYDDEFFASYTYYLYALTDTDITLAQINNTDFEVTQTGYPLDAGGPKDWLVLADDWEQVDPGIFRKSFKVRNQDSANHLGASITDSVDRTANITITHPEDVTVTDTTTIEQDAYYRSDNDTITLTVTNSLGANFSDLVLGQNQTDTIANPLQFGQESTVRVYITMSDWENDFNLFNYLTTDSSITDTYKQYPRPKISVGSSGPYTTFDNVSYNEAITSSPSSWSTIGGGSSVEFVPDEDLIFNSNYNASDPNNNYQYYFDFNALENNSYNDREITFGGYHSQNSNVFGVPQDVANFTQPVSSFAQFTFANNAVDNFEVNWGPGTVTETLVIKFTGDTAPTVGIWDDELEQFFALAENTTALNFFSYSLGTPNYNTNSMSITISCLENTPLTERNIQLGVWHSSLLPPNSPQSVITINQIAQPFDPVVHNVEVLTLAGSEIGSGDGGIATFYFYVEDYTSENFTQDNNKPVVNVIRMNGPNVANGPYEDENGLYVTQGVVQSNPLVTSANIIANPAWESIDPNLNISYTHSLQIPYGANDTLNDYFFAVKARHQYDPDWQEDDYAFVTLPAPQALTITEAYATEPTIINDGEGLVSTYNDNLIIGNVGNRQMTIYDDAMSVPEGFENYNPLRKIKLVLRYNNGNFGGDLSNYDQQDNFGSLLYPNERIYTYFRFLSSDKTNIFKSPSDSTYDGLNQENMPVSFVTNDGNNNNDNSTYILNYDENGGYQDVGYPTGSTSQNYNNATIEASAFPILKFGVELFVSPNPETSSITHFIGVWKGDRAPRTNLINTNITYGVLTSSGTIISDNTRDKNYFIPNPLVPDTNTAYSFNNNIPADQYGSAALIQLDDSSAENLKNHIFENNIYQPIESTSGSGIFDGFKWNHADNTSEYETLANSIKPRAAVRFLIHKPTSESTDQTSYSQGSFHFEHNNSLNLNHNYGDEKQIGISFEIEDYEINNTPFWQNIAYMSALAPLGANGQTYLLFLPNNNGNSFNLTQLYNFDLDPGSTCLINGNGKYEFRFKSKDSFVEFVLNYNQRFTVKNLTVWEILDDIAIRPGQTIDFTTAPDDIIKIIHVPASTTLSFSNAGVNGSPMSLYLANLTDSSGLELVYPSVNDTNADQATVAGTIGEIQLEFINEAGTNPTVRVWDGANSSDISTAPAWIESVFYNATGGNPAASISIYLDNFYSDVATSRTITFGLYNGTPTDTTTAPLDTFVLIQQASNLDDLGA